MKKGNSLILIISIFIIAAGIVTFIFINNSSSKFEINLFHEGLVAVRENGKSGYINEKGETVINFLYDSAGPFQNGVAIVRNDKQFSLINKEGKSVTDETYDNIWIDDGNGLIWFEKNYLMGLMNSNGQLLKNAVYNWDNTRNFSEGLALVSTGKMIPREFGYINEKGKLVFKNLCDGAGDFHEGYAYICLNGKYDYINIKGEISILATYDNVSDFHHGLAIVRNEIDEKDNYQVIDTKGKVLYTDYDCIERTENRFIALIGQNYYLLDERGNKKALQGYQKVSPTVINDILHAKDQDGYYNLLNENGEIIFPKYDSNHIIDSYDMKMYKTKKNW